MTRTLESSEPIGRDVDGIECYCGGCARRVDATSEERNRFGCRRDLHVLKKNECCVRVFMCGVCHARIGGRADPPEME